MKLPTKIIITLLIFFASKLVIANPLETIRDTTQSWADAFNSRDTENILDHYSEEAVFWGTVSPTLRDEPARVFGEIAVNTGYYQFSDMHDGKKTLVPARFSFVYERNETGAWLIVDHHSSSVPTLN